MTRHRDRHDRQWTNWAGNQHCRPASIARPIGVEEIAAVVRAAATRGERVKVVGAGHSFSGIAVTDGVQVHLDRHCRLRDVDPTTGRVTVEAGLPLAKLSAALWARGLALENLGDIDEQSVAGAISTSTHGTGAAFGGLATQVEALELVLADGTVSTCSPTCDPQLFAAATVGLGALGIISAVTLRTVDAFNLHARQARQPLAEVLEDLDDLVEGNDHFEFFWIPHTEVAMTKRHQRTGAPPAGRGRAGEWLDRVVAENVAFGALCRAGRWYPALVPRLAQLVAAGGSVEYTERSHQVFTSPRWVHFVEMEYALPREAVRPALQAVVRLIAQRGWRISFPVEVRFSAGDDLPLSIASGRPSAYIAVHQYRGVPYQAYFRAVEEIMMGFDGRPHWGKLHYQDAASLAPRYPAWDAWQTVRRRVDPDGRFANPYLERVVGAHTSGQG